MAASKYATVKASVEDLLVKELGSFLADSTDGRGKHAPSALLGQELTKAFETYYALKRGLDNETIDCALMALTKSGKSTVINALTGANILPSNNVPETARVVSIEHTKLNRKEMPYLTYKLNDETIRVEGESEIYSHLEYCNKEVRSRQHRKEDEQVLAININIAALPSEDADQQCRLRLLDTPGTNEANEDRLRHSVERLLDSVDAVVYILDYTKLKTIEEASLLAKLKEANPQLVQRLAQRLFFVVNKIDSMHSNAGLQEEELCEYVADLITKQMNSPAFQLRPDQVMLVSAQEALLARLVLLGKASEDDRRRFGIKAWGSSWARKRQTKSEAEMREQAACMLEDSRLPELEERLFSYLYSNAGGLKLLSLLDNMCRLLNEVHNGAATGLAALQQSASDIKQDCDELQGSLSVTLDRFDAVQKDADDIESDVTDNVQARMQTLKEKLFAHVNEVLDGVEEPVLPAVRSGPWKSVWEKATRFLRRSGNEAHSDQELKHKLQELHQDIKGQISNEIQQFWHDLEVATNKKHQQLIGILNEHLDSLARDVECVVGAALNLKLEPISMELDPPNAQQFHRSIQELFDAGIGRHIRTEKEAREEHYTVWETRRRGLCRTTEYYVGVPVKRTVEYDKEVTTFQLDTDRIKEYFQNMVNVTVDTSIKHVRAYVHAYLSDNIKTARDKISGYGSMYSDIMHRALEIKTHSFDEQDAGMKALQAQVETIKELLAKCGTLQVQATELIQESEALNGWQIELDTEEEPLTGPDGSDSDEAAPSSHALADSAPAPAPKQAAVLDSSPESPANSAGKGLEAQTSAEKTHTTAAGTGEHAANASTASEGLVQAEDAEVTEAMTKLGAIGEKSASPSRERSLKDEAHDSSLSQRSTTIETECNASAQPREKPVAATQASAASKPLDIDPFMDLEYDWGTRQPHQGLPVSDNTFGFGTESHDSPNAGSHTTSPVIPASMDSGSHVHQTTSEGVHSELPRQDSLDSSEWECLSHEQYSADAHHLG